MTTATQTLLTRQARNLEAIDCHTCPTCFVGQGRKCMAVTGDLGRTVATHRARLALV